MMSWRLWDWKFVLTITVTIVGVLLPFIWQSNLPSKALELRLSSLSSLQPQAQIRNVQILLDGEKLESPYAASLELINTGSNPIMSTDFDAPIEVVLADGARYVNAQITSTNPRDLPIQLDQTDRALRIAKHLSNPGDSVILSVVTSGKNPKFDVRSRIAGISQISFVDQSIPKPKVNAIAIGILLTAALGLFAVTSFSMLIMFTRPMYRVPMRVTVLTGFSAYLGAIVCYSRLLEKFEPLTRWSVAIPSGVIACALVWLLCRHLIKQWDKTFRRLPG